MLENKSVEEIPALSREKGPISVVVVQALHYPQWVKFDFEGTFLFLFLMHLAPKILQIYYRGAIGGKTSKTAVLPGF